MSQIDELKGIRDRLVHALVCVTGASPEQVTTGPLTFALKTRVEIQRLRQLVQDLVENDPDDMAGDGITVLEAWRMKAREALADKR